MRLQGLVCMGLLVWDEEENLKAETEADKLTPSYPTFPEPYTLLALGPKPYSPKACKPWTLQ